MCGTGYPPSAVQSWEGTVSRMEQVHAVWGLNVQHELRRMEWGGRLPCLIQPGLGVPLHLDRRGAFRKPWRLSGCEAVVSEVWRQLCIWVRWALRNRHLFMGCKTEDRYRQR